MGWLLAERKRTEWKQSWTERTLASISAPPMALLAFFGIVVVLWSLESYWDYKEQMKKTTIKLRLLLFLLPVVLIALAELNTRTSVVRLRTTNSPNQTAASPWGVALLVGLLLLMLSYQSTIRSNCFRFP